MQQNTRSTHRRPEPRPATGGRRLHGEATTAAERRIPPDLSAEELLLRVRARLRSILARHRIPHQDAEDLVQDSLVLWVRKGPALRDPEAYLVTTLQYRCLMYWRSRSRRRHETMESAVLESLAAPQAPTQEAASLRHDLRRLLSELTPRRQRLIRLRYGLGYTVREVAAHLGAEPEAIRQRSILARSLYARHISRHNLA